MAASITTAISVVILLTYTEWQHLWLFSAAEVLILGLVARDLRIVRFAVIATGTFTVPLLAIHGIINPHFLKSSFLFDTIPVRQAGLIYAAEIGGRLSIISNFGVAAAFVPTIEGVRFLLRLRVPTQVVLPIAMSLALLKDIQRRASIVYEAQQARGIPVSGSVLQRIKSLPSVVIPVAVSTLIDSQRRADCLRSRCFEHSILFGPYTETAGRKQVISTIDVDAQQRVRLEAGESYDWVGPVDSGKSILAREIALGISDSKRVSYNAQDSTPHDCEFVTRDVAWLPTDCRWLFSGIAVTVADEVLLALLTNSSPEVQRDQVDSILQRFQLTDLRDHHPFTLSGGESIRLALAIAFAKQPRFLVLDQAFEFLDPDQQLLTEKYLAQCRVKDGLSVCHFRNRLTMQREQQATSEIALEPSIRDTCTAKIEPLWKDSISRRLLTVSDLSFRYNSGFSLDGISLALNAGQVVFLKGQNGAGKTTLLKILALLIDSKGSIHSYNPNTNQLDGKPARRRRHLWAERVGYAFQNPSDQLFKARAGQEVALNARTALDATAVLELFGLRELMAKNPYDIPLPLQRMTTLASVFAMRPSVILLDEPTAYLDRDLTRRLTLAMNEFVRAGHAFLVVTHDELLGRLVDHSTWLLEDGKVQILSSSRESGSSSP